MFENLSDRLSGVFDRLTKQGALSIGAARGPRGPVGSGCVPACGAGLCEEGSGRGDGPSRHQIHHAGPASRQNRAC